MIPTFDILLGRLLMHEHFEYVLKSDPGYRGIVDLVADLPASANDGDFYVVKETMSIWYWDEDLPGWVDTNAAEETAVVVINDGETKPLMSHNASTYRTIEYIVSITDLDDGDVFSAKVLAHHDGTEATYSQYDIGKRNVKLSVVLSGSSIVLQGEGLKDNQQVKSMARKVIV